MAQTTAPTKANLFRLQDQLKFATQGCELLHQKRDVLVMELMGVVSGFSDIEQRLEECLGEGLDDFLAACLELGSGGVRRVVSLHQPELDLSVDSYSVMGISLPHVSIASGGWPPHPGLLHSTASLDKAINALQGVLDVLVEHIETIGAIWRLATEVEKTQRRINALESVFIPEARDTIGWIKSVIEETEREELFRRKLLKRRSA